MPKNLTKAQARQVQEIIDRARRDDGIRITSCCAPVRLTQNFDYAARQIIDSSLNLSAERMQKSWSKMIMQLLLNLVTPKY